MKQVSSPVRRCKYADGVVLLEVPHRTQFDASAQQGWNCVPACLSMVLAGCRRRCWLELAVGLSVAACTLRLRTPNLRAT